MSDTMRVCPSCGKPLAADAPQGVCPECLMKAGFGTASGDPGGASFEPPKVEELRKLFPQLEILELIGKGGMGAVYKARQPALDRLVALKILPPKSGTDPGFAERFTREARTLAKLSHPNIVAVYDFGQVWWKPEVGGPSGSSVEVQGHDAPQLAGGTPALQPGASTILHYFIMEYVDGPNLRQIEQAGKITPRQALQIIPQICEALQFAHDEGVVHRDIKPENVLMDKRGRVKIADFGLAKILGLEPKEARLTGAKDIMGTPHYMAPEQVERPQEVDHRADIYSLGVVFYEMLTGELPLGRFAPPSSRARAVEIDVRLDEVVLHALEKEPARRYQHASQIKTAVETIAAAPGQPPPPQMATAESHHLRRQVHWPAIGLLVTGILNWLLLPLLLALLMPALARQAAHHHPFQLAPGDVTAFGISKAMLTGLLLTPFVLCSFLIYAALKMMRFEAYAAAVAASIIAMVVTPGNCLGFPIGIWALVVLSRPEVRAEFRRRSEAGLCAGVRRKARWPWIAAASALLVFLGFILLRQAAAPHLLPPAETPVADELASFKPGRDQPISRDLLISDDAWLATCTSTQTFRLFEFAPPLVDNRIILYQAKIKTAGLTGRAYLEMACRFPGRGEFFSPGVENVATGSNDWATYQTPFFLKSGETADLFRLNLVVEGSGQVFIKDIQVIRGSTPP